MKRIFIVILVLLVGLIYGCVVQKSDDVGSINFDNSKITGKEESVVNNGEIIKTNVYMEGDILFLGNKEATIKKIGIDSKIEIEFEGSTKEIYETKQPVRLGDYELMATKIDINYDTGSTVTLESRKIELGENEYLFWFKESKDILGKKVTLTDVSKDEFNTILVDVSTKSKSDSLRVHQGESKAFDNLEITNVRSVPRVVSAEKYAIIKVKLI